MDATEGAKLAELGQLCLNSGMLDKAKEFFEAAVAQTPGASPYSETVQAIIRAIDERDRPCPAYLEPEAYDTANGRMLRRHFPMESYNFVYAIDVAGTCNLRCPSCPVGNFTEADRPKGFMDVEMFRAIVAKIKAEAVSPSPRVWLFNWGEPLLHPHIEDIIAISKEAGLYTNLSTNLSVERDMKGLAKSGIDRIKISLSGISDSTYPLTHKRGNLALVKGNMHLLSYYLHKFNAQTFVWLHHHLYKNNQHEIPEIEALAASLGFRYSNMQAYYQSLERCIDWTLHGKGDADFIAQLINDPRDVTLFKQSRANRDMDCEMRFNMMAITHDGTVDLCCGVYDKSNSLAVSFLDKSHAELQAMKYNNAFCKTCYDMGLHYAPLRQGE